MKCLATWKLPRRNGLDPRSTWVPSILVFKELLRGRDLDRTNETKKVVTLFLFVYLLLIWYPIQMGYNLVLMIFCAIFSSVESSSENFRYYFTAISFQIVHQFLWFFLLYFLLLCSFPLHCWVECFVFFHWPANTTRFPGSTRRLSFPFFHTLTNTKIAMKWIELNVGANQTNVVFCVASPFDSVLDGKITVKTQNLQWNNWFFLCSHHSSDELNWKRK